MLKFCWLSLLMINLAEAAGFISTGCPDVRYRAISGQTFVLPCDLLAEDPAFIFNNSCQKECQVQWLWRPSGGKSQTFLSNENVHPMYCGNVLWFNPIMVQDSGTYTCTNRGKLSCVDMFVDVQTKEMANCSKHFRSDLRLIVESGESIACPGKSCYSHFHTSKVKWYKNGKRVKPQTNRRGLKLQGDTILLRPAYDRDRGIYVCDYRLMDENTHWNMRTIVTVDVTSEDSLSPPIILDPTDERSLEAELGQPLELKCQVKFGFHSNASSLVRWYRETSQKKELIRENRFFPNGLGGETFIDTFWLEEVTENDLCTVFVCVAKNSVGKSEGIFRLKRRKITVLRLLTLCCAITIVLGLFLGSAVIYQYWIEIVLLYRNYLAKDETVGDNKEFDAFVSYAKPDFLEADQTPLNEEQFALEVLPQVLEDKYGYKLCLTERDILPGGATTIPPGTILGRREESNEEYRLDWEAYTDDILNAIKRSRRTVVILSPSYVNGPAMFELEAAVKTALEDTTLKLILVQFKPCQAPELSPRKVKKALKILPRITWKVSTSPTSDKRFWKKLRYHMPVKHIKGAEGSTHPSHFSPSIYSAL